MHVLAGIPIQALAHLEHGHRVAQHQGPVFGAAVGNGHAVAQKGFGLGLARLHAGGIARGHAAAVLEQPGGLVNGVGLVAHPGAQAHGDLQARRSGGCNRREG